MKQKDSISLEKTEKSKESVLNPVLSIPLALSLILSVSLIAGVLMGFVWETVCFLRYYGSPLVITDKVPSILLARDFHNEFLNQVAAWLDVYNSSFPNNMRYGSGLGLIAGAIASILLVKGLFLRSWSGWIFRLMCGATAGAVIGGRLNLVFNSDPLPFLWAMMMFALGMGVVITLYKPTTLPHVEKLLRDKNTAI